VRNAAIAAFIVTAALSSAAVAADAETGRTIARQWCAGCHIVEAAQAGGDSAPAFPSIANDPNRNPSALRAWLSDPHPPMPNLQLSRSEIDDVIAYLQTLRQP